jgi:antitoxin HicB
MARGTFSYPVTIEQDEGVYVLSFRDIPEAIGQASSKEEINTEALDILKIVLGYYFKDNLSIPEASEPEKGEQTIDLPLSLVAKIILHNTMLKNGVRPADLARRMDIPTSEVARITNPRYKTKIDTLASAVSASGGRLQLISA